MKKVVSVIALFMLTLANNILVHAADVNKSMLEKATQKFLETQYPRAYFIYDFPVTIDEDNTSDKNALDALLACGLVTLIGQKTVDVPGLGLQHVKKNRITYDITEKGKSFLIETNKHDRFMTSAKTAIAFGKAELVSIDSFSPVMDFFGEKITQVKFTYKVVSIPEWIATPEIVSTNRRLKEDVESGKSPISKKAAFIYQDNEWIHEKLFKKK